MGGALIGSSTRLLLLLMVAVAGAGQQQPRAAADREILAAHNAVRADSGVAPLLWSDELAGYAREWAERLVRRNEFRHRPGGPFGENLFEIRGASTTGARVVREWASEARDYDLRRNRCRGVCGHYTQIVWEATQRVGCAVARRARREVWVCNYDPPGNVVGERPY
jgi:pathogenesis-related protein 1